MLAGVWTVGVTVSAQVVTWGVEQLLDVLGVSLGAWVWPLVGWFVALLVGAPAVLLALVPRSAAIRVTGRLWLAGALAVGAFGTIRALPVERNWLYLLLVALTATTAALTITRRTPAAWRSPAGGAGAADRPTPNEPDAATAEAAARPTLGEPGMVVVGVAAGLAVLAPWLFLGALGRAGETGFALAAAGALGWLAALLLDRLWPPFTGSRWRRIGLAGLVAGVFLAQLGAATGASGAQLAELLVLPPLGFAAAALGRRGAVGALVGLAALGPLAFLAPAQTSVIVNSSGRDVGFWALLAACCALVVGLLLSIGYGVGLRRTPRPVVGVVASLAVVAAGVTGYVTVGAPGFHGDRLFVVMREQADLTGLPSAVPARRAEVYHRLVDTADRTQAGLRKDLSRLRIGYTPYYLVNGVEVDGGPAVREWLSTRSDVDRVLLSPYLRPIPAGADPMRGADPAPIGPQWNVTMLHADQVWATGDRGQGVVIGTSDTGVDGSHPALAGSFRGGPDSWYDPWNGTRTPTDHNGHGTHTLGSALGGNGIGVAPGAQWMGCVNLDRDLGNPAYYLDCLQFMLAPFRYGGDPLRDGDPTRAADVLTNSWGCPGEEGCDRSSLRPAIDALTAAGIFVVAAAGNTGVSLSGGSRCGSITDPPAPYPDTFTVGAVDRNGAVASFSSRGPVTGATKPDVLAPGDGVLSTLPGGGYGALSGTSMATPHVAGVVALMWSANPALVGNVARTAQILRQTAGGAPDDGCGDRAGIVDASAAVAAARAA